MAKRDWQIDTQDYETENDFRNAVQMELAGLENIGHRLGGAFVIAPVRVLLEDEHGQPAGVATLAWHIRHENAPAVKPRREQPREEPVLPEADAPAPEPVVAGD